MKHYIHYMAVQDPGPMMQSESSRVGNHAGEKSQRLRFTGRPHLEGRHLLM